MPLPKRLFTNLAVARPTPVVPIREQAKLDRDREAIIRNKVDRVHRLLSRLEARAEHCDAQAKLLKARAAKASARVASIEKRTLALMSEAALTELIGNRITLTRRENGVPKVIVDDETKVPAEYLREKLVSEVDKVQIKAALARDPELAIAGVHLAQTVSLLRK